LILPRLTARNSQKERGPDGSKKEDHPVYTEQYKSQAGELMYPQRKSVVQIARDLGCSERVCNEPEKDERVVPEQIERQTAQMITSLTSRGLSMPYPTISGRTSCRDRGDEDPSVWNRAPPCRIRKKTAFRPIGHLRVSYHYSSGLLSSAGLASKTN